MFCVKFDIHDDARHCGEKIHLKINDLQWSITRTVYYRYVEWVKENVSCERAGERRPIEMIHAKALEIGHTCARFASFNFWQWLNFFVYSTSRASSLFSIYCVVLRIFTFFFPKYLRIYLFSFICLYFFSRAHLMIWINNWNNV